MGLAVISEDIGKIQGVKVARKEFTSKEGRPYVRYSIINTMFDKTLHKYTHSFIPCKFRKGVELKSKTRIKILKATFFNEVYTRRTGDDTANPILFIFDFEVLDEPAEFEEVPREMEYEDDTPFV